MGYALITGGGPDGRYTIRIDSGEVQRLGLVAALQAKLTRVDKSIADCQVLVTAGEAMEAQQLAAVESYIAELEATMASLPAGSPFPDQAGLTVLMRELRQIQAALAPNRIALAAFKLIRTQTLARLGEFERLQTLETRQAWCADFTEDAAGRVATLEIPGDSALILIAPRGRVWIGVVDGELKARELMSPEQAYFNAAILPGWQIDRPMYRWGTLTDIDWDGNTGKVTMGAALSSAQRLNVNRESSLSGVPFEYMESDARAFDNDSRVVLDLRSGWTQPRIIGFLDNPRPDPPTLDPIAVFDRSFTQDEAVSVNYSSYWTGGKNPRTYSLQAGALPGGITLNGSTGVISGTPTAQSTNSGIVIRCADALYDPAKNRRYDDSYPFQILVYGGWTFYSGTLDDAFHPFSGEHGVDVYTGNGPGLAYRFLQSKKWTTGVGEEILDQFNWVDGSENPGFPSLWVRLDYVGDAPVGTAAGAWVSGWSGLWTWRTESGSPGTIKEASYTVRWSRAADGSDVVATVAGYAYVEYPP